jgi:acyl phosphate:glycerol-3-phosphate acyltransferase
MTWALLALLVPLAYLLGSVPFGLLVGLAKGIDPRTAGSGNIGATNLGRLLGGRFFALVFFLDMLKSFVPMMIASFIVRRGSAASEIEPDWHIYFLWLFVGFAAFFGHMFSIFLKFKGGKGVATSCGLILGLYPYYTIPALCTMSIWVMIYLIWRTVSLASIVATMAFPPLYVIFALLWREPILEDRTPLLIFAVATASMIVYRHRANIRRILDGTEHRFGRKSDVDASGQDDGREEKDREEKATETSTKEN